MANVFISPFNEKVKTDCEKRKEAGSILNQMFLVLETMKDDLDHRKKYLTCGGRFTGKRLTNIKLLHYSSWWYHNPNWIYFRFPTERYDYGKRAPFFQKGTCYRIMLVTSKVSENLTLLLPTTLLNFYPKTEKLLEKLALKRFFSELLTWKTDEILKEKWF